ncbi:hypothetical protein PYCC9005_000256 [Savitreella phatthalungensis]
MSLSNDSFERTGSRDPSSTGIAPDGRTVVEEIGDSNAVSISTEEMGSGHQPFTPATPRDAEILESLDEADHATQSAGHLDGANLYETIKPDGRRRYDEQGQLVDGAEPLVDGEEQGNAPHQANVGIPDSPVSANGTTSHKRKRSLENDIGELTPLHDGQTTPRNGQLEYFVGGDKFMRGTPGSEARKAHVCEHCGANFTRQHNLKSHLLTHTSNKKEFVCKECNVEFRRLHDLKRHEKLHTGEKPYVCEICGRRFARADALARHSKSSPEGGCVNSKKQGRRSFGHFDGEAGNDSSVLEGPSTAESHAAADGFPVGGDEHAGENGPSGDTAVDPFLESALNTSSHLKDVKGGSKGLRGGKSVRMTMDLDDDIHAHYNALKEQYEQLQLSHERLAQRLRELEGGNDDEAGAIEVVDDQAQLIATTNGTSEVGVAGHIPDDEQEDTREHQEHHQHQVDESEGQFPHQSDDLNQEHQQVDDPEERLLDHNDDVPVDPQMVEVD